MPATHDTPEACRKTGYCPPACRSVLLRPETSFLRSNTETIVEQDGEIEWD